MAQPKVSIIVPNYNSGRFLKDLIESVLSQTYQNWELVIVDDNSSDESPQIAKNYSRQDSRIVLAHREDDNKGACQRRNQGFKISSGEFVCFMDADDILPDDTLEIRVNELLSHPEVDMVVVPAISFKKKPYDLKQLALGLPLFNDDLKMFVNRWRLPFAVVNNIYRKDWLIQNDMHWDEKLMSFQDADYNIRSILKGLKYKYSENNKPGYFWRIDGNPGSITKTIKSTENLNSQLYYFEKLCDEIKNEKYGKDLKHLSITLILRFALFRAGKDPEILLSDDKLRIKYKILRNLYRLSIMRKLHAIIDWIFFPATLSRQYGFILNNRLLCKKYINKYSI